MPPITFIDTEINPKSRKILDIGALKDNGSLFHQPSVGDFARFVQGVDFVCGHNILNHDIKYIRDFEATNSIILIPICWIIYVLLKIWNGLLIREIIISPLRLPCN